MRVAGQTAAAATRRFVVELEAKGEDKGQNELNERFAIAKQVKVGGWLLEIDGEGAVLAFGFVGLCHVSSPSRWW